jgi:hypothetical protein
MQPQLLQPEITNRTTADLLKEEVANKSTDKP